jgi:hypothetical protein
LGYGNPHIPNKAERKLLVNLMKKGGLTEEQVRANKGNRQALAKAAQSMSQPKEYPSIAITKQVRRRIVYLTKLSHHDPKVKKIMEEYLIVKYKDDNLYGPASVLYDIIEKVCGKE